MFTTDSTNTRPPKRGTKLTFHPPPKTPSTFAESSRSSTLYTPVDESDPLIPSCVRSLSSMLDKRRLSVTIDGEFFKVLSLDQYKINFLKICSLILVGFLAYVIRRFPYHPITIIGNTVYSRVAASTLLSCGVPVALCAGNNHVSYYETENGKEVPFEGPSPRIFLDNVNQGLVPMIPLSSAEISKVEEHTGLKHLSTIQTAILSHFQIKDGVYLSDLGNIIAGVKPNHNPVMQVKKFFGNLYYIMTTSEIWLTRLIISDTVMSLQPGEIISTLHGKVSEITSSYNITDEEDKQIITQPTSQTELIRRDSYNVGLDLVIKQLFTADDYTESIIYSLNHPRNFIHNSICTVHPFHLPMTWDPFLTMMIVTRGYVQFLHSLSI